MLIDTMEVTGIEGNFRVTCNVVMRVLRQNKDSLMAVLEAFVYDPLLNWRLVDGEGDVCVCVCVCARVCSYYLMRLFVKCEILILEGSVVHSICCYGNPVTP